MGRSWGGGARRSGGRVKGRGEPEPQGAGRWGSRGRGPGKSPRGGGAGGARSWAGGHGGDEAVAGGETRRCARKRTREGEPAVRTCVSGRG